MRVANTLYYPGTSAHPTADGRTLRFAEAPAGVAYHFALRVFHRDDAGTFGPEQADGIEHRIWVADEGGCVWTAASRFTSTWLVDELARAGFENGRRRFFLDAPTDAGDEAVRRRFDGSLCLADVRYGSDDRLYRTLVGLAPTPMQVIFKYTTLMFDVVAEPEEDRWRGARLYARVQEGSLRLDGAPLPAFAFELDRPQALLARNTAAFDAREGRWVDGPFVQPLVFARTAETDTPQRPVQVR